MKKFTTGLLFACLLLLFTSCAHASFKVTMHENYTAEEVTMKVTLGGTTYSDLIFEINGREYTVIDIAPRLKPENIKVMINDKEVEVISLQTIYETYNGTAMPACVLQTEKPQYTADKQTVTVEYNTICDGNPATSQGRCQFYIRDSFVNTLL